ncbi:uncharacterized protein [Dysidea avara]|uniref:uncharacterized protein isoform X2 n=1 Tax=Dysidea avara TaxID=196820 RepID=UPI00333471FE
MNTPTSSQSEKVSELTKTPKSTNNKGAKRKLLSQSPISPSDGDGDKANPLKKRRKHSSSDKSPLASPSIKPALTERQQLAIVMQMTTPHKQEMGQGANTTPGSSGRSKLHRRNERGETPLHSASIKGELPTVITLLEQGADVNTNDHAGWTPLHEAANHGHAEVVTYLLDNGANINAPGMDGDTPLHDAVENDHFAVVKVLLDRGADPQLPNDNGRTASDVAKMNVNRALYKLLTGGDDLPASLIPANIEVTPKAKVLHRKRRTSQELLLESAIVSIPLPPDSKFFQKNSSPSPGEVGKPQKEPGDIKPPTRPDTLARSHAEHLYSDISSSDDWEFASPLHISVDKKLAVINDQRISGIPEPVKYSDISSPSDNSPAIASKLMLTTTTTATLDLEKVSSEQPLPPATGTAADDDAVFTEPSTTAVIEEDKGTEEQLQPVKDEDGSSHVEEDQDDTITEEVTTPTMSCDDNMTDVEVAEEPLPDDKTIIEHEEVAKEGNMIDKDDEGPKDKPPTPDYTVASKATDKVVMKPVISMVKLPTDKIITLPAQKPQTLVKSITKPYQAPELQKLTTPFTIATSSFKTGGIDNKLPKSGIITKSLFLPSPTKGNTNNSLSASTKPQNSRNSPVRSSSLVRTTSIVLPKPVTTVAASSGNTKLTIPTVTTKTFSTLKTTSNGNHSNLTKSSTFSVAKPFQSNGTSKVLSTVTTPRTLTAPMVSKTLVVSSSTMKASNSLAMGKQDVKILPQKVTTPHVLTASAAAPLTTVMATNTANNKPTNPSNTSKHEPTTTTTGPSSKGVTTTITAPTTTTTVVTNKSSPSTTKKKPSHEVIKSKVLDQRRRRGRHGDDEVWRRPEGMSSFLLSTGDHSNHDNSVTSTDPRNVVPSIPPELYLLFRQQQEERNDLVVRHCVELERLQLSLEQNLIRQYQRHCGQGNPPNMCDALVEQMLPYWYTSGRSHDPTSRSHDPIMKEDIDTVVKETWKKFYNLKVSVVQRHRCEAEALQATQRVMWSGIQRGASYRNIPSTHIPLVQ